jgi:hypothetical protein
MKINFNTNQFFAAHGKQPRGWGMWMVNIEGFNRSFTGNYGEVKKEIKSWIKNIFLDSTAAKKRNAGKVFSVIVLS